MPTVYRIRALTVCPYKGYNLIDVCEVHYIICGYTGFTIPGAGTLSLRSPHSGTKPFFINRLSTGGLTAPAYGM